MLRSGKKDIIVWRRVVKVQEKVVMKDYLNH
jgi:hypothetical protein